MDIQRPAGAEEPRVIVDGSARTIAPADKKLGPVDPNQRIDVTIRLRPKEAIVDGYRPDIDRDAAEARFASRPDDAARVAAFARANGLDVVATDLDAQASSSRATPRTSRTPSTFASPTMQVPTAKTSAGVKERSPFQRRSATQ